MIASLKSICSFSIAVLLITLAPLSSKAQTTVWTVDFNNGCAANCLATSYGGWTVVNNFGGVTGSAPNNWFVSCAEEGIIPPGCGSSCIGDASLHIGANPGAGGDMGASFNETGATNATFRMAVSPTISTVGYNTLTLRFDHIAFGSSACSDDAAFLRLSTDNGATWPVGFRTCLNTSCCSGGCNGYDQGLWTLYTQALPAAFDNNPNVRIGFEWRNNGNGSGTDPSVAIDDIFIIAPVLPVELVKFTGQDKDNSVQLDWTSSREGNFNRYDIERSSGNVSAFEKIGSLPGKGVVPGQFANYQFKDASPGNQPVYYRLKMVDLNGSSEYSEVVRVVPGSDAAMDLGAITTLSNDEFLSLELWAAGDQTVSIEITDLQGKLLRQEPAQHLFPGKNALSFNISSFASGLYMVHIKSRSALAGFSPVDVTGKFTVKR